MLKKFPLSAWLIGLLVLNQLATLLFSPLLFLSGGFLLLFLLAIIWDVCRQNIKIYWLALPLLFFGWYFYLWSLDMYDLWELRQEINQNSDLPVVNYNPEFHSLVVPDFSSAGGVDYDALYMPAQIGRSAVIADNFLVELERDDDFEDLRQTKNQFQYMVEAKQQSLKRLESEGRLYTRQIEAGKKILAQHKAELTLFETKLNEHNKSKEGFYVQRQVPKELCLAFDDLKHLSLANKPKAISTKYNVETHLFLADVCWLRWAEEPKKKRLELKFYYGDEISLYTKKPVVSKVEVYLEEKFIGQYRYKNKGNQKLFPIPLVYFGCTQGIFTGFGCEWGFLDGTTNFAYPLEAEKYYEAEKLLGAKDVIEYFEIHPLNQNLEGKYQDLFLAAKIAGAVASPAQKVWKESYKEKVETMLEDWPLCLHSEENCITRTTNFTAATDISSPIQYYRHTQKSYKCAEDPSFTCKAAYTHNDIYQKRLSQKTESVNSSDFKKWGICKRYIDDFEYGCARYQNKCNYCQLAIMPSPKGLESYWSWQGRKDATECTADVLENRLKDRMSCVAQIGEPEFDLQHLDIIKQDGYRLLELN